VISVNEYRGRLVRSMSVLLLLVVSLPSYAVLTIEIAKGIDSGEPIAVVPFAWSGKQAVPQQMHQIIAADLQRSGYFSPLAEKDMIAKPSEASQVSFTDWRALKMDHLVVGRIQALPDGTYQVQFQLFDVYTGTQLAGYSIRSRKPDLRRTAHQISDLIYKAITGVPGAFDTRIAYVTATLNRKKQKTYRLAVADSDGHNERVIFESANPLMSPTWAPNGKQLAFVSFSRGRPELYLQNILSGQTTRIAEFKGINSAPSFSPDGRHLALTLSKDGNAEIYVMDLQTRKLRRITRNYAIDTEPTWMPQGDAIVFTSDRGGSPQLYRVDVNDRGANGRAQRLTFDGNWNARASVSPNGRYLAMVHREEGRFRIAVQDLQNGHYRVLTDSRLDESPSFSPNSAMIIYATEDNYRGVLAAVSVDGRARQRLRLQSGDVREPAWSSFKSGK